MEKLEENKKFWEELIAYFPLIRHGPHRKRKTWRYTRTDTQTARLSHKPSIIFFKVRKIG
jgi:hypothetical protein